MTPHTSYTDNRTPPARRHLSFQRDAVTQNSERVRVRVCVFCSVCRCQRSGIVWISFLFNYQRFSRGGWGDSLNPCEDNQISNQTVWNGCLQSAGRMSGALPCPNSKRLQMRSLNCVPEDVSCARLHAVAPSPVLRVENCRNMEIASYCLGGEAICQLNQVMGFRKVKLGRSVSHAAALALSVNTGERVFIIERDFMFCGEGSASLRLGRRGREGGVGYIIASKGRLVSLAP